MKYPGCEGTWTEERFALLSKLWNDGASASQIAKKLGGVTRNAVIGKVHRAGLSNRPAAAPLVKGVKKPKEKRQRVHIARVRTPSPPAKMPVLRCVEIVSEPVSFIDRTRDQCAFMLDGFEEPTCCGATVKVTETGRRLSNCPAHEALAHATVQPRRLREGYFAEKGRPNSTSGILRQYRLPNDMREAA